MTGKFRIHIWVAGEFVHVQVTIIFCGIWGTKGEGPGLAFIKEKEKTN